MVGGADHVLVVLDHEHAVADVAQVLQGADQPFVVALVQPDAGLVQHVHDAGQARADLGGEADPLRLAAGQRLRAAVEAEVVQAHVIEELQAQPDLAHHLVGNLALGAVQLQAGEVLQALPERRATDLGDGPGLAAFAHLHVPGLAAQPGAMAFRAGLQAAVAGQFLAHRGRVGLAVAPFHVGDDAFEWMLLGDLASGRPARLERVGEADVLAAGALQDRLPHRWRQVLERRVDVEAIVPGQALQQCEGIGVAPVPALDRAAGERQRGKRDHPRRIEEFAMPKAVARRTGADRRIEREQARLELGDRPVADRAGELRVEPVLTGRCMGRRRAVRWRRRIHFHGDGAAVGQPQRRFEALGQPLLHVGTHAQAVDHDVDVVLLGLLQLRQGVVLTGLPIDAEPDVAVRLHFREQLDELALAVAHHRRHDHQARFGRQRQHCVHHLRHRLRLQRDAVVGAVGRAGPGEQQPQVVVDLGDGADGGARVVRGRLLLDRDRRRQALDHIHVGLVHQLQELPGIRGQALDIAALAFGIQRVEGQRRLARSRQAGDHHQLVARDVEVDVLEIVGPRPADADQLGRRRGARARLPGGLAVGRGGQGRVRSKTRHHRTAVTAAPRPAAAAGGRGAGVSRMRDNRRFAGRRPPAPSRLMP